MPGRLASESASRSCGRWRPTACPSEAPAPGSAWSTSTACSPQTARTWTRRSAVSPSRRPSCPAPNLAGHADLADVIDAVHPTALIGLSTAAGAFTEQVVRRVAAHAERPIIMPLSNPTSRSEARPQDLADWTEGRALVAAGSPFPPMRAGDASIPVAQCNNIYIFPRVGLAVTAVRATRITDAMMTAAAAAVGEAATIRHDPHGTLLPGRAQLAEMATVVAGAVAKAAVADAVAPALDR